MLNKFEYEILKVIQEHPGLNPEGIAKYCDQPANIIDSRMTSLIRNLYVEIGCGRDIYDETYRITAYSKSQATEQYVKIEIIRESQAPIIGAQSQNVSDSRNSFEKNGIQQKK